MPKLKKTSKKSCKCHRFRATVSIKRRRRRVIMIISMLSMTPQVLKPVLLILSARLARKCWKGAELDLVTLMTLLTTKSHGIHGPTLILVLTTVTTTTRQATTLWERQLTLMCQALECWRTLERLAISVCRALECPRLLESPVTLSHRMLGCLQRRRDM